MSPNPSPVHAVGALPDDTYLLETEVAAYLRLAPKTLRAWRGQQKGPPYHKLGGHVRYLLGEVRAWAQGATTPAAAPVRGTMTPLLQRLQRARIPRKGIPYAK